METKTYKTVAHSDSYKGVHIVNARRFFEDEKSQYATWFAALGFVAMGDVVEYDLSLGDLWDILNRQSDGMFLGCDNQAWIITEEDESMIITLAAKRAAEKTAKIAKNITDEEAWYESVGKHVCPKCGTFCDGDCEA